jgi:hypothetical protein
VYRYYTIVTKEWSPAMLEHYEYSNIGIEVNKKKVIQVDALGMAII